MKIRNLALAKFHYLGFLVVGGTVMTRAFISNDAFWYRYATKKDL